MFAWSRRRDDDPHRVIQLSKSTLLEGQNQFESKLLDTIESTANLMITIVEGKISAYVRSDFTKNPLQSHSNQWKVIVAGISQK